MIELFACPFCGKTPHFWVAPDETDNIVQGVCCTGCHMFVKYSGLPELKGKTTIGDIQAAVAERWNKRSEPCT